MSRIDLRTTTSALLAAATVTLISFLSGAAPDAAAGSPPATTSTGAAPASVRFVPASASRPVRFGGSWSTRGFRVSRSLARRPLADLAPRAIGRRLAAGYGWTGEQWSCLDSLWTRESHWQVRDTNGSSGAYGIPQALPATKMASAGADWESNPVTQIRWGLHYIEVRYGTPCAAWDHSQAYDYY